MVYTLSKLILWPVISLFIKDIKGLENLPDKPVILVSNHSSYIDALILIMLVAWHRNRQVCTFATNEKFTGWFWDALFNHYGAIRVNGSLKKGVRALRQGKCMGIFPEGGRTPNGKVQKVTHSGLGVLALKSKKQVVPLAMNTYNWWNTHQLIPNFKQNIKIVIGKPMTFKGKLTKPRANKITKEVMTEVKRLARISHA